MSTEAGDWGSAPSALGMRATREGLVGTWNGRVEVRATLRVMTAARYFVYMDYARWAAVTRYGMVKPTLKNGWAPVVGAQQIIHRKPLLRGSRFDVKVRCVGWEAEWFHYVHVFAQRGETRALSLTKTGVWKKGRMVPTTEVVTALEGRASEMPPPAWVQRALAGEDVAPE